LFLKSIDINGFKSFADRTHIDFSDGITSLLGPNGCGKSNIVDSIKWVLGEQSTKTLRAGKMEDVIFNGTDTRKPLQFAEVTLTIDNSEKVLPTDYAEIEIKRRVFRSGESEYYLNRNRCLLKNIRDLFFDTGVGKSAYSILEQGKIDQILSQRPEDRRYIFEEAAGISRFKADCKEAERKLERTDENIQSLENIIKVEKRSYDSLKSQAQKAQEYKELNKIILELDAKVNLGQVQLYQNLIAERKQRSATMADEKKRLEDELLTFKADIESWEGKVREVSEESHRIQYAINRKEEAINGKDEKIKILEGQYHEFLLVQKDAKERAEGIKASMDRDKAQLEERKESLEESEENLREAEEQVQSARKFAEDDVERITTLNSLAFSEEESIQKGSERLQSLSVKLQKVVEDLATELDQKMGDEYSFESRDKASNELNVSLERLKKLISDKMSFYKGLSPDFPGYQERLNSDLSSLSNAIDAVASGIEKYKSKIPPFLDTLLAPEGLLTEKRKISDEEERIRLAEEKSRARIKASRDEISRLQAEIDGLRETIKAMEINTAAIKAVMDGNRTIIENLERSIEEKTYNLSDAESQYEVAERRIKDTNDELRAADQEKADLKSDVSKLKADLEDVISDISQKNGELLEKQKRKGEINDEIMKLNSEIEKNELWIDNTNELMAGVFTSFYNSYTRPLQEFQPLYDENEEPMLLRNELEEKRKELAALGPNINHMAVDDFKEAEERYGFYVRQMDDLNKAKADLEKVLQEIQSKSEELFLTTYKQISDNFQAMFRRLFGGGRAEITLQDKDNVLSSGIDIFAQPPGKKLISLTLLSGGERSMTAVALLFATYLVKPSPFCILDEIDAALDDKNIGYFLSVLQDFAKSSQFIIITHNTHTVMGSSSLLGVTQMEAGVSTTVTYKLANRKGEAVILDEDEKEVTFDSDGRANK